MRRTDRHSPKRAGGAERDVENYRDEFDRAEKTGRAHSAGDLRKDISGEDLRKKP